MLPKNKRIPRDMHSLFKASKALKGKVFLVRYVVYNGKNSRFSFSISKKLAKNATVRNKMRRQGYRVISRIIDIVEPKHLVSFSYKSVPKNINEIETEIYDLLSKSKIINRHNRIL